MTDAGGDAPHLHCRSRAAAIACCASCGGPYTARMYRALVERLAAAIPGLGLGADVIVGHPGETEDDFAATLRLVEALPFSYLHVFAYSDRNGTEAARRPGHVPAAVIRERSAASAPAAAARRAWRSAAGWSAAGATRWCWSARSAHRAARRAHRQLRRGALRGPRHARAAGSCRVTITRGRPDRTATGSSRRSAHERGQEPRRAPSPRWGSSAAAGSTRWRASRTCAGMRVRTPFGEPSDAYCTGRLGGPRRHLSAPPRPRPPAHARRAELPRQHLRPEDARRRARSSRCQRGGQHEGGDPPARPRHPRPVLRPHQAARLDLLRRRHRRPRRAWPIRSAPALGRRCSRPAGREAGATVHRGGTYICIEGPQFSTRGESADLPRAGACR